MRSRTWIVILATVLHPAAVLAADAPARKPNIIIVLADDMGWRDTGYNGNKVVKTPNLDDMAAKAMRFDFFYPGQQMCSPGRHALMTGRNPMRVGLHHLGSTRSQEIILARALKQAGYQSAQFGKWHLGAAPTSPVKMGFDMARWTPNFFDLGAKFRIDDTKDFIASKPEQDSSIAVMDLALDYIRKHAKDDRPFFTYVAFGSPHAPHRAAEEFKKLYQNEGAKMQDYWGEVSGLDAAVGNLRAELRKLGIGDNTIVWFTSDNGGITPHSQDPSGKGKMTIGCRVPALLEWPARIPKPVRTNLVSGHVDVYPTLLDAVGVKVANQPVLDGISLLPAIDGKMTERPRPIGFLLWQEQKGGKFAQADFVKDMQGVWIDGKYKLIVPPEKANKPVALYDIYADQAHKNNLAEKHPDVVQKMRQALVEWQGSVRAGYDGKDYGKQ